MNRPVTYLSLLFAVLGSVAAAMFAEKAEAAGDGGTQIERQHWTFSGLTGHYDRAQLQRGYQIYKDICSACHSMKLLHFRNLGQKGGPEFSEEEVKALAAGVTVIDGPDDEGLMVERPGKPSDPFPSPFKNDKEAAAANNGAVPPDLSVIAKARGIENHAPWYWAPAVWASEIASGYQEGGADYLYALLTGYGEPPKTMKMVEGMNYNAVFPGHQIAMPAPLSADSVEYSDGSPQTVPQYSKDVTAFLMWAAEPDLEARKKLGFSVLIYLGILALLFYLVKRKVWRKVEH